MLRKICLLACLAACCFLLACNGHGGAYVVRHADRDGELDRLQRPAGEVRAEALADRLETARIAAIFSTDFARTRGTAQPLADRLGLPLTLYSTVPELARRVRGEHTGKTVLIVGHSNTVPQIVTALGGRLPANLPLDGQGHIHHDDFDNLEFVLFKSRGRAGVVHSTYGAPTPPP